ncbi:hypothetical protein CKO28_04965 [Rhodovibrio sodomensis]|uniref:Phosphoadenosine phosphosulphate reductase domain-containing protein n=1 Tax=Rhodovibrio sodomensis TaxID=1088 RepID=A0ABS1DAY2_9PROT|nr:phosphoadenosine phosphosulfate reductase family protein [Rhodovibrio sodomensis]MBK1667379.1 hypothetical protein [Rhodovibrio sodomensis]
MTTAAPAAPDITAKAEQAIDEIARALARGELVAAAFSGGKDSSVVLGLALQAWTRVRDEGTAPYPLIVVSGNTGIENPAVHAALLENHRLLEAHARHRGIDLEVELSQPSVADSYLVQLISGRALPTWTNTSHRACSVALKLQPGTRAVRHASERVQRRVRGKAGALAPLVLVGSRVSESAHRAGSMTSLGVHDGSAVDSGYGTRTQAPIAGWSADDVWEWLALASDSADPPFQAWRPDFEETVHIYRESAGECPVVVGDRGPKAACGARHGCALCTASGARDRSLEQMLTHKRNAYMRGLNELRNWLANSQYRWDLRAGIRRRRQDGREIVRIGPGTYSPDTCAELLAMCLTLDQREQRRAETLRTDLDAGGYGDAYLSSRWLVDGVWDRHYAQRMVTPQFRLIDTAMLTAIDFYWALNAMHPPFHAWRIFRAVCQRGCEVDVRPLEPGRRDAERPREYEIPAPGMNAYEGLRDHCAEFALPETHAPRPYGRVWAMEHDESLALEIDAEAVDLWMSFELDDLLEHHADMRPFAAAAFYLRNGLVSIPRGRAAVMDGIARRGQWIWDNGGWNPAALPAPATRTRAA